VVLVTGATGFVGGRLVSYLLSKQIAVRVLVRDISKKVFPPDVEVYEGDILDITSLQTAMNGIEKIYHCAAYISYLPNDYDRMYKTNVEGTTNVVNIAIFCGVKKLIHVSSIAAIGARPGEKLIQESSIWDMGYKQTRYGISKMMAEHEVYRGIAEGLDACIVNPGVILGKDSPKDKSSQRIFTLIKKGLAIYPTGSNGFVDIEDVVITTYLLGEMENTGERYILVAENLSLYNYLCLCANILHVRKPKYAIRFWMIYLAIILDFIRSLFTFKKRILSFENMYLAQQHFLYDNTKVKQSLSYSFKSIEQSLSESVSA
jgi:nucleoside-diphosphate-sugar epimerase